MAYKAFARPVAGAIESGTKEIKSAPGASSEVLVTITKGSDDVKITGWDMDAADDYTVWQQVSGTEKETGTPFAGFIKASDVIKKNLTYGFQDNKAVIPVYTKDEMDEIIADLGDRSYSYSKEEVDQKVEALQEKDTELDTNKSNKPAIVDSVLSATGWTENTYSLEGTYPAAQYDLEIYVGNASDEQYNALSEAKLLGSTTTNVLTALGTVPTIDIPVIIKAVKK